MLFLHPFGPLEPRNLVQLVEIQRACVDLNLRVLEIASKGDFVWSLAPEGYFGKFDRNPMIGNLRVVLAFKSFEFLRQFVQDDHGTIESFEVQRNSFSS